MHSASKVRQALALADSGVSVGDIVERLGVPRSTVRTWLRGEVPRGLAARPDDQCKTCGADAHDFASLPVEYVHLLGMYLGDGCIAAAPRRVFKLRVFLDATYPEIMAECEASIRAVMPSNEVGRVVRAPGGFANSRRGGSIEMYSYSRAWPCLLPQHGPGRKHERSIVLADWQRRLVAEHPASLLRGLIQSDGCRFINTGTNWSNPRYSFSNRSDDIRGIFKDACDLLGVRWTEAPTTVYVSRKADVLVLDEHIGPKR